MHHIACQPHPHQRQIARLTHPVLPQRFQEYRGLDTHTHRHTNTHTCDVVCARYCTKGGSTWDRDILSMTPHLGIVHAIVLLTVHLLTERCHLVHTRLTQARTHTHTHTPTHTHPACTQTECTHTNVRSKERRKRGKEREREKERKKDRKNEREEE